MIEINLEDMKGIEVDGKFGKCNITLTSKTGSKIYIVATVHDGEILHDALEKVCIAPEYHYEEMQKEIDRLTIENEDLREEVDQLRACEYAHVEGF